MSIVIGGSPWLLIGGQIRLGRQLESSSFPGGAARKVFRGCRRRSWKRRERENEREKEKKLKEGVEEAAGGSKEESLLPMLLVLSSSLLSLSRARGGAIAFNLSPAGTHRLL